MYTPVGIACNIVHTIFNKNKVRITGTQINTTNKILRMSNPYNYISMCCTEYTKKIPIQYVLSILYPSVQDLLK